MVALVIVLALVLVFVRDHWGGIYDDALIYLRYVKNLRSGCGLRFNCDGLAVEGFTSPLYLAILSVGSLITTQLIDLCQIVCTASLVIAVALAIGVAIKLARPDVPQLSAVLTAAITLVLALDHFVLLNTVTGMETALAAAATTAIALAAVSERPWGLVAAVTVGLLVRPENLVFVIALPLLPWMRRPRFLLAAAGAVFAITATRYAIFGALAPNTYYAKSGGSLRHLELGLAYLVGCLRDFPLVLLAPFALLGASRQTCGYLLVATAAWVAFFLRSGGDTFEYSRMLFPLVPMLAALALAGISELASRLRATRVIVLAAPFACAALVGGRAYTAHAIPPQHTSPRVLEWAATGTYLRKQFPGATVAVVPIGAIGYFSDLPIIDLVGLTEPEIARAGRTVPESLLTKQWIAHERHLTEYVLERAPTLIVTTMVRDHAWHDLSEARAGFYADWLLLQEIKAGRAPYHVHDAEVTPGVHVLMFARDR